MRGWRKSIRPISAPPSSMGPRSICAMRSDGCNRYRPATSGQSEPAARVAVGAPHFAGISSWPKVGVAIPAISIVVATQSSNLAMATASSHRLPGASIHLACCGTREAPATGDTRRTLAALKVSPKPRAIPDKFFAVPFGLDHYQLFARSCGPLKASTILSDDLLRPPRNTPPHAQWVASTRKTTNTTEGAAVSTSGFNLGYVCHFSVRSFIRLDESRRP